MINYSYLVDGLDEELKTKLLKGWSFCKIDDKLSIVPRALIEDDDQFDRFIKDNSIKHFVFRWRAPQMGILATARNVILANEWVSRHGLIPYNDFEWGYIYECNCLGKDNFFEYVFEQETTIEEIWNDNLICGDINWEYAHDLCIRKELFGNQIDTRPNCIENNYKSYYENLKKYSDKWIKVKKEALIGTTSKVDELHLKHEKVLGMAVREAFNQKDSQLSEANQFLYHPHEPDVCDVIDDIVNYMRLNSIDNIYVTAQTSDTIMYLKSIFGKRLLFTEKERSTRQDFNEAAIRFHETNLERNAKKYYDFINSNTKDAKTINTYEKSRMIDYVREIITLSYCDAYVGGKSGGAIMACIWNGGKYESIEFWPDSHNSTLY